MGAWEDEGSIRIQVAAPREALCCGQCGCRRVHIYERARREWKSAPLGTMPVVITMDSPKVKCLRCDSKTWHQPTFANGQRRVTKTFEKTLSKAYYLKEDLRQFWNHRSKAAAEKHLDAWCRRAEASGIRQMHTMAKTLRKCRRGLLNWYDHRISTGPLEGINNKIGALQRRAYGYRNYEQLKEKLLTLHHTKFMIQG